MFSSLTKLQSKLYVEMLVFHTHIIFKKIQKKKSKATTKQAFKKMEESF